jgi:cell wall-associated NlpC family hydrolase
MRLPVRFFTFPRHPGLMFRIAVAATTAGLVTLGGGYIALGAAGEERVPAPVPAAVTSPMVATATPSPQVSLPPLPEGSRAKAVAPVAGVPSTAPETVSDAGLSGAGDAKPKTEASSAARGKSAASVGGSVSVDKAVAIGGGVALPPLEAPEAVKKMIEAGNGIARTPYKWGGGHGKWQDTGYDCSGSVSFVLAAAGLLDGPLASGPLMSWGEPGRGKWVTIWTNQGHVFLEVAGIRFDTSAQRITGSRWINEMRSTDGFVARHPPGL